ncbi:hypothetical protein [Terriglobus roseus]|uniref:Uncharacterized protein n=1 Tax=Terriglobus roseus TaxID=392734 RepID=A0A1H4JP84_9BACT|nr:hypothetical protein [Terriglobus roseus]SEB47967.1 hypothetical protein SAMN05443244_0730 [Terriglobus roseus]
MTPQRKMNWIGLGVIAAVLLLVYVLLQPKPVPQASRPVGAVQSTAAAGGPSFGPCPVLPADNVWNTRIDKLPRAPQSQSYIDSIGPLHGVHPDFGTSEIAGIPITEVPAGTTGQTVSFDYADESDAVPYPIPPNPKVEGGSQGMGDRHILLIDEGRCVLYELFAAERKGDGWKVGSGIVVDLTSNALRPEHKTSADAAGLPILPGLVRYEEVGAGQIRHAIRFTLPQTQAAYVWPARHVASKLVSPNYAPLGQRFRLRSSFDVQKLPPQARVIAVALKQYGMILADNGGALYLSGVPDSRWSDDDLHKLSLLKAEDFEAVDESAFRLLPDSGRVNPISPGH